MALPPQFRADAKSVYVSKFDTAWDQERITKEVKELEKKRKAAERTSKDKTDVTDQDGLFHPVGRYFAGHTRYDINALNVKDYLDESKNPVKFMFRKLSIEELEHCRSLATMQTVNAAYREAFRLCVEDISGLPEVDLSMVITRGSRIPDKMIERLRELVGLELLYEVGEAIITASGDLQDWERKA